MGDRVGAIPRRWRWRLASGAGGRARSTEGSGRHSHVPGGGGERQAAGRHRAPEARAGRGASVIEAELGAKRREEEKREEKLQINH